MWELKCTLIVENGMELYTFAAINHLMLAVHMGTDQARS